MFIIKRALKKKCTVLHFYVNLLCGTMQPHRDSNWVTHTTNLDSYPCTNLLCKLRLPKYALLQCQNYLHGVHLVLTNEVLKTESCVTSNRIMDLLVFGRLIRISLCTSSCTTIWKVYNSNLGQKTVYLHRDILWFSSVTSQTPISLSMCLYSFLTYPSERNFQNHLMKCRRAREPNRYKEDRKTTIRKLQL
jgi:hypothetical protein